MMGIRSAMTLINSGKASMIGVQPAVPKSLLFYPRANHSTVTDSPSDLFRLKLRPHLPKAGKIIIPISMARLDPQLPLPKAREAAIEQYHKEIDVLLSYTSSHLERGELEDITILSTAQLQAINWNKDKIDKVEELFFSKHEKLLKKHTAVYRWEEFIKRCEHSFIKHYEDVVSNSGKDSDWYNLMERTHKKVKLSNSLEGSIQYQRNEYASMLAMKEMGYSHLLYLGHLSEAWEHMYSIYHSKMPSFIHAAVQKSQSLNTDTLKFESNLATSIVIEGTDRILSNPSVPKDEKARLVQKFMTMFRAYQAVPNEDKEYAEKVA